MAYEADRPYSRCGTCQQEPDQAPKLQLAIAPFVTPDGLEIYHPHDFDKSGCIYYHMDCDSPWHEQAAESNPHHAAIREHCKSGVQNEALHAAIVSGAVPVPAPVDSAALTLEGN